MTFLTSPRNERTAILVQAAALCSRAVYRKDPDQVVPDLPGYTIEEKHWVEPTRDGSGKAAALFEIAPGTPPSNEKVLVVAIRGSWCLIDWLVNLNDTLEDAPGLVVSRANYHSSSILAITSISYLVEYGGR